MRHTSTLSAVYLYTLCTIGLFMKGVKSNMHCFVCGPGDDEEACVDPTLSGLQPVTCLTNARQCSVTLRREEGEVTYRSRECAETCQPQETDALQVQCCTENECNHGHAITDPTRTILIGLTTAVFVHWVGYS